MVESMGSAKRSFFWTRNGIWMSEGNRSGHLHPNLKPRSWTGTCGWSELYSSTHCINSTQTIVLASKLNPDYVDHFLLVALRLSLHAVFSLSFLVAIAILSQFLLEWACLVRLLSFKIRVLEKIEAFRMRVNQLQILSPFHLLVYSNLEQKQKNFWSLLQFSGQIIPHYSRAFKIQHFADSPHFIYPIATFWSLAMSSMSSDRLLMWSIVR